MVGNKTSAISAIMFVTNITSAICRALNFNWIINNIRDNNAYKKIDGKNYCLVVFK